MAGPGAAISLKVATHFLEYVANANRASCRRWPELKRGAVVPADLLAFQRRHPRLLADADLLHWAGMEKSKTFTEELNAIGVILGILEPLDDEKRKFVLRTVTERLGITGVIPAASNVGGKPTNAAPTSGGGGVIAIKEIGAKDFMKVKNPQTDSQRIACLAFYLTHNREQNEFKTVDLRKLNEDAHGIRLSNPAVAVMNATDTSKFLAPAGHGKKRITTLGEDVVEALPDQEAVKAVIGSSKAGRRKKTRKKTGSKGNK